MLATLRGEQDHPAVPTTGGGYMSTDPVRKYVSYLTADELAACIARITDTLSTTPQQRPARAVEVLTEVREDLRDELARRQMSLLDTYRPKAG